MEPLKVLLEKKANVIAAMQAILDLAAKESRDLTAEETAKYDEHEKELDALEASIGTAERRERLAAASARQSTPRPAATRGAGAPQNDPAGILRAGGPEPKKTFEHIGEFLHAVRFNQDDPRLAYIPNVSDPAAANEFRMDQGPQGGFLVPKEIRSEILSVPPQTALVRPRARVIGAGSSPDAAVGMPALDQTGATQPGSVFGGMTFGWVAEGGAKPQTDATLREVELVPKEFAGYIKVTDKLLRNWQGSQDFLTGLMREALAGFEDYYFIRGNGVGQPLGAINAGAVYTVTRTGANLIQYLDIENMASRLLRRGLNPIWSICQQGMPQITHLEDDLGNLIYTMNAKDSPFGQLFGMPVFWNNRQPALGTTGDIILADWSYYLIKDGFGPSVAVSEHVDFLNNKTVVKIFSNVDGAPWLTAPFKEENGFQVSPFVVLS